MKFEGSNSEHIYNEFWNNEVVKSYNNIIGYAKTKDVNFFSATRPNIDSLVEQYCNGVMTIVNNLIRQRDNFKDKEYIATYLANAKAVAIADLQLFKKGISFLSGSFHSIVLQTEKLLENKCSNLPLQEEVSEAASPTLS